MRNYIIIDIMLIMILQIKCVCDGLCER